MSGPDGHGPFAALNLPSAVLAQAEKLLLAIGAVRQADTVRRAADRAEGWVLGIETVKALNAPSIEALYIALDHAATLRLLELEQ